MKLYTYKKCSTCTKAVKFLKSKEIDFKELPIRETPPSKAELKKMLKAYDGEIKKLFNTSGQDYRAMKLKDSINDLSQDDAFELLASNGNLVKRPFLIDTSVLTVGFKEELWNELF